MSENKTLNVFFQKVFVGIIRENSEGIMSFQYSKEWLGCSQKFSISPSLPLRQEAFGNRVTRSYFENLLPEGQQKDKINRLHRDIAKNTYQYLASYGEDCAGALIITKKNRNDSEERKSREEVDIDLLDEIFAKNENFTATFQRTKKMRFSLAGAQDKISIIYENGKVFIPATDEPTTHILKPPISAHGNGIDTVFNEYFCMKFASDVGIDTPDIDILQGKFPYFIVRRYDRKVEGSQTERIHQYDFCQALGYDSSRKYEEEKGPGLEKVSQLIRQESSLPVKDLQTLIKWVMFNLVIGNNDTHNKNISMLCEGNKVRLSPAYDLISTAVYPRIDTKFAYGLGKIGRKQFYYYKLKKYHLNHTALQMGISPKYFAKLNKELFRKIESSLPLTLAQLRSEYGALKIFDKLEKLISKRLYLLRNALNN